MEFTANPGKSVIIRVGESSFARHVIKTPFVTERECYIELLRTWVQPLYQPGDIVCISEKIIAVCQGRIIRRDELPVGRWARFLSRFASQDTSHGYGVGQAVKMQYAIRTVGLPRVLLAAVLGGIGKLVGVKGVFYRVAGQAVSGLDGFYDGVWDAYRDIGIEIPENPAGVCDEILETLGMHCMIVDANDLGQEILGCSREIGYDEQTLKRMIRDNPAGQGRQCTPFVLIRKVG